MQGGCHFGTFLLPAGMLAAVCVFAYAAPAPAFNHADTTVAGHIDAEDHASAVKMLASILRSAPTGIGLVKNRVIVEVNDYILDLTGYRREELIGRHADFLYPSQEDSDYVGREKYRQITARGSGSVETRWLCKDGSIRHVLLSSTPLDLHDLAAGVTFTVLDITERKIAEDTLRESEARFAKIFSANPAPLVVSEIDSGRFIDVNDRWVEMLGYPREEQLGRTSKEVGIWTDPEDRDRAIARLREQGFFSQLPIFFRTSKGNIRYALWSGEIVTLGGREVLLSMLVDETDRRQVEQTLAQRTSGFVMALGLLSLILLGLVVKLSASLRQRRKITEDLRASEHLLSGMARQVPGVLFQFFARPDGRTGLNYISDRAEQIFGIKADPSGFFERFRDLIVPEHREGFRDSVNRAIKDRAVWHCEGKLSKPGGEVIWFTIDAVPLRCEHEIIFNGIIQDITGRKQAEEYLRLALREKETLLRELYHRTKNSMQVICSMLSLQSSYTGNALVEKIAHDMVARIQAMALVHQKLYQAQDLSRIGLDEYLRDLLDLLFRSYNVGAAIDLKLDLAPVAVLIDVAVPCGLIINELVTNTIKHAFPDGRPGEITLRLTADQAGAIELNYADNGVGVPSGFDFRNRQSLGMQSIFALVEQQLQGEITFSTERGLGCRIRFVNALYKPRV